MKAPLHRKIAAYGIGAGAAALAAPAQADIHYSGALDFTANTIYFDLTNTVGPSTDMQLADNFELSSSIQNSEKPTAYGLSGTTTGAGEVAFFKPAIFEFATPEFAAGDTIGSQLDFGNGAYLNNFSATTPGGEWQVGDTGFLGLQIDINGQIDYGWAEVRLNSASPVSSSSTSSAALNADVADGEFTLLGYALDTSGLPIQAGAIPEPSSLALLALGAAGVVALRRRRK
jgi:hypothetical protein